MKSIELIQGGIYHDHRGTVRFINDFDLKSVRRFYQLTNSTTTLNRGWQAHKIEEKWFYAVKGKIEVSLVKISDWNFPEMADQKFVFHLSDKVPQVLFVPSGFANCLKMLQEDSIIQVFSTLTIEEAAEDQIRFPIELWQNLPLQNNE